MASLLRTLEAPGALCAVLVAGAFFAKSLSESSTSLPKPLIQQQRSDGQGLYLQHLIPLPKNVIRGKRGLLVLLGGCMSCSAAKYRPGSEYKHYDFVVEVQDVHSPEAPKALSPGRYLLSDLNGRMHRVLKAFFPPRAYEVDDLGRVTTAETGLAGDELFRRP